jgi:hypothetical protein
MRGLEGSNLARWPQGRGNVFSVDVKGCAEKASAHPFSIPYPTLPSTSTSKENRKLFF